MTRQSTENEKIMKLWATEQNRKDFYIDLFSQQLHDSTWMKKTHDDIKRYIKANKSRQQWQKCDEQAGSDRNRGNDYFRKNMFHVAIDYYNKCLCFAKNGSSEIHLAYSNRSACFFNMKMYKNCLIDIDLAIKCGYPENLIHKLIVRRDDCIRLIAAGAGIDPPEPKLDFRPNSNIPFLADTIKCHINHNNKICFVANDDLKVGKVIVREPSYFGESFLGKYAQCNICMKSSINLVPCETCTVAMTCAAGSCMKQIELHDRECAIKPYIIITNSHEINYQMPLIRSISMATKMFAHINGLIAFVRKNLTTKMALNESIDLSDPKEKYAMFLRLHANKMTKEDIPVVYSYYTTIMNQPIFSAIFKSLKQKRFLQHLIMQHFLIMNGGAMNHRSQYYYAGEEPTPYEIHLQLLPTMFQHSCEPNIMFLLDNGSIKGVVLRPIQPGDQLTVNRLGIVAEHRTDVPKLLAHIGAVCYCDRCESHDESIPENKYLQRDPDFIKINVNKNHETIDYNEDEANELEKTCILLLKKYGRIQWCKEIDIVSRIYRLTLIHRNLFFDSPIYYLFRQ